jgi:hypothetical protein
VSKVTIFMLPDDNIPVDANATWLLPSEENLEMHKKSLTEGGLFALFSKVWPAVLVGITIAYSTVRSIIIYTHDY